MTKGKQKDLFIQFCNENGISLIEVHDVYRDNLLRIDPWERHDPIKRILNPVSIAKTIYTYKPVDQCDIIYQMIDDMIALKYLSWDDEKKDVVKKKYWETYSNVLSKATKSGGTENMKDMMYGIQFFIDEPEDVQLLDIFFKLIKISQEVRDHFEEMPEWLFIHAKDFDESSDEERHILPPLEKKIKELRAVLETAGG